MEAWPAFSPAKPSRANLSVPIYLIPFEALPRKESAPLLLLRWRCSLSANYHRKLKWQAFLRYRESSLNRDEMELDYIAGRNAIIDSFTTKRKRSLREATHIAHHLRPVRLSSKPSGLSFLLGS